MKPTTESKTEEVYVKKDDKEDDDGFKSQYFKNMVLPKRINYN